MADDFWIEVREPDTVVLHDGAAAKVWFQLDAIRCVTVYKRDLVTTDLICAEIAYLAGGQTSSVVVHEELPGFDRMMERFTQLPGFDENWWDKVVKPAFETHQTVVFERG